MATLRQFHLGDLHKISKCNLDPYTETYDINFYLEYHAKWPALFQVCEDTQGNIIGYIMGKLESSPRHIEGTKNYLPWHGHITALTVSPSARRMGIGRLLTEQLEDASDAADAWFVDLFVRKSNTKAIKFYEGMGYSVYRVVKDYYGDDVNDPTATGEDAYDMRKPTKRDKDLKHIREDGRNHSVNPNDIY
jgi:N-terminal acetyltransferase B complex catalytic subunit